MLTARLEDRFREHLGPGVGGREDSVRFAVDFVRLLARVLPDEPSQGAIAAMRSALDARSELTGDEISLLIGLALAPENRSAIEERELRAFGARFGPAEEEALRAAIAEEIDLTAFGEKYGPAEALLLLDALFAVCAEDEVIDGQEIARLQQSATALGIDPMLVGALFRKHDARHAQGDFSFDLTEDKYLVGRSPSASIQLPDPQVGVRHVDLVRGTEGWRVVDLGSGRPTMLDGQPVGSAPFRHGQSLRIGPYTLQLDPDEKRLTAYGLKSFSALSVRDLRRKIGEVTLLDGVSFTVFSGEVIAMVGPSGAGKTTLLTAIAGIAPADTGDVLMDGQNFHGMLANDRSIVGIVPQDDVVHGDLTVEESLRYAGRLRFPSDVGSDTIGKEVDRVLDELTIDHIRSSRIGDAVKRGISGGQRKRVSLGQELLTHSTKILFLDEPTSGLDPQTAQDIVALVRQLADDGRIIFLVTHDLTPSVMSMVDHLIVLAPGGRLAWFGPPDEASNYFGVDSPDEIFAKLPEAEPEVWGERYREGEAFRKFVRTREHLLGLDGVEATTAATGQVQRSQLSQYVTLTRRYAKVKVRDYVGTAVLLAQAPILALAMFLVFQEPDWGAYFMLSLSSLWFGANGSVRELISERTIWQRESRVGLGVLPYMASKITVLGALVTVQCTTLAALTWVLLRMGTEYGVSLPAMSGVCVLTGIVGMSLGLMMSAIFSSSEAAVGTLPLVLIPQIAFGGLIVTPKYMPEAAKYVADLMFTRYSFEAILRTAGEVARSTRGIYRNDPAGAALINIGLRTGGSDPGVEMPQLIAILGGSAVVMLVIATWLTARAARN